MQTHTITTYSFSELSEEAKQKAIEDYRYSDSFLNYNWWEFTYEDASAIGLKITSSDCDRKHIEGYITGDAERTARLILENHGENTETYGLAKRFLESMEVMEKSVDEDDWDKEAETLGQEFQEDLLQSYLRMLQEDLEYLESDECIVETLEASECEFLEDGTAY